MSTVVDHTAVHTELPLAYEKDDSCLAGAQAGCCRRTCC